MQLVDLLDADRLPPQYGYDDLYRLVRRSIDETHMEGRLKAEIIANPERFVARDPEMPLALLDQKEAGKKILLITNSEWSYAEPMLIYTIDPFLPEGMTWRDLFDIAIVSARKPEFFTVRMPAFEIVNEEGLLREHVGPLRTGSVYVGANARLVEQSLGLRGEEILYVGDHMFVDVNVSKNVLRWRTALILRELEDEIAAREEFEPIQQQIDALMEEKEALEAEYSERKLRLQRIRRGYAREEDREGPTDWSDVREKLLALDETIAPLARQASDLLNPNWGPLMRVGKDKSHLARQVERYADIYMSRVSNFLPQTPFAYFRSHRGSMPHD
ncbi:MAG TPA: 5'-nucleotidase domain-containing protein, partial [Rhodothermales bacterium]